MAALGWVSTAQAGEQKYYTWVDEMGRVHNSPIRESAEHTKAESEPINRQDYLNEQEFEDKLNSRDDAVFYTWVDEQGRVHNQVQPRAVTKTDSSQAATPSYDHSLIPPERLASAQRLGCCRQYIKQFEQTLTRQRSKVFKRPEQAARFTFQGRTVPAYFMRLEPLKLAPDASRELSLKLRYSHAPMALVALSSALEPLYLIPQLNIQQVAETWRSLAYQESLIELVDDDIHALVVFFPTAPEPALSLEVTWQ